MAGFSQSYSVTSSGSAPTHVPSLPPTEDYFSVDDILASQLKLPCCLELPVYRLGFLNPNSSEEHLETGTKLELPYWLARVLCSRRRQIVSVELPKPYREAQRHILRADANVVDLYKLGPYYYSLGVKLLYFEHPERMKLSKSLLEVFLNRFRKIMDFSQNAFQQDTTPLTRCVCECVCASLEPRPSLPKFYFTAVEEKNWFSPWLRDKIWAKKAYSCYI